MNEDSDMATPAKPKIATAHLTGCFGCHMSVLDIDERLLELIELVDFDKSPIDDIKRFSGPCLVGIIEGGCSSDEHVETLHEFRRHCQILVVIGECAIQGNIPAMRNSVPLRECLEEAFVNGVSVVDGVIPNDPDIPLLLDKVYPVHEIVKVDYFLPGCPPSADTLWAALTGLLSKGEIALPYELIKKD